MLPTQPARHAAAPSWLGSTSLSSRSSGARRVNDDTYTLRITKRRPTGSLIARRGARAGLPKRHQTDAQQFLAWEDVAAALDAERFAAEQGMPLNLFLTVTWRWPVACSTWFTGERSEDWSGWHRKLIDSLTRWLKARGIPVVYLFVRERCVGHGAHTHFMVHLPVKVGSSAEMSAAWHAAKGELAVHLRKLCYDAWGMSFGALDLSGDRFHTPGMVHATQRRGLLDYLGKAMNPDEMVSTGNGVVRLAELLGIDPKPQSSVPVKRVGWSQNIGEAARKIAGFKDTNDVLRLAEQIGRRTLAVATGKRRRSPPGSGADHAEPPGSA